MTRFHSAAILAMLLASFAVAQAPPDRFQADPKLPAEAGVPYVIITGEALAPSWSRLVEWKKSTGMPAQVVTVEWLQKSRYYPGVDLPERLYRLLQDLRMNWKTRWVLLGGDVDILPAQRIRAYHGDMGGNQIACDVYYSDVLPDDAEDPEKISGYGWNANGDRFIGDVTKDTFDMNAELYVGRVPAGTPAEVDAFLDKYCEYCDPKSKDLSWCSRAVVVGAHEFESRQNEVAALFREIGGAGYTVEEVYERKPKPIEAITDELNKGEGFWDFFCHGCPAHFWACNDHTSWGITQVKLMKNEGRYPIVFANSCDTTEYDKADCLATAMVLQPKGGGVAYLGYSNLSFGSTVDREMFRILFSGDCPELGKALVGAKKKMEQDKWVTEVLQLMGEPEMWARTAAPSALKIAGDKLTMNVPARLTVTDAAGKPLKHARVMVDAAGVWLTAFTDDAGVAVMSAPVKSGAARAVAFAQNGLRFEKKITIDAKPAADAVAVARPTLAVDDSADEPASSDPKTHFHGNAQKDLNPGETVKFAFTWPRESPLPEGKLELVFDEDKFVKVVAGPEITQDRLGAAFTVKVAGRVPTWHQAWAVLTFRAAAGDPWTWIFRQPVEGPFVTCVGVGVDDSDGNKDKRVGWEDAGKKVKFSVALYNSGTQKASALKVTASSTDPSVTMSRGDIAFGGLPCEEPVHPKEKTFEFALAANYDGHPVAFALAIEDDRHNHWEGRLVFTIPPAPPILARTECGVKSVMVSWTEGGSPGVVGYNVYRAASEKGPFTRLTEQPIRGATRFPDPAVKPMTGYAYVVTAVTADGLESRYSAPAKAHTLSPLPRVKEGGK